MNDAASLVLPSIQRVILRNFSLYSAEPLIDIAFPKGVFCLAGANGLGKSTFLSTLNYALTGIVPDPERSFKSVPEYYRHSLEFSGQYFTGRIAESQRDTAEVEVELSIGQRTYALTRGFFEQEQLRALRISNDIDTNNWSAEKRNKHYASAIAEDTGLDSFEQFVFLQHFVCTFDERRHLLFWDQDLLGQILYLTFGLNPTQAQQADLLRREAERADSRARNFNWQATEVRKKLDDLNAAVRSEQSPDEDLRGKHEDLTKDVDRAEKKFQTIQAETDDTALKIAEFSGQHASLRAQYDEQFAQRLKGKVNVSANPVVALSIADQVCQICGSKGNAIADRIQVRLDDSHCPLCDTPIAHQQTTAALGELRTLDKKLVAKRAQIDEAVKNHARVKKELTVADTRLKTARRALSEFERANVRALDELLLQSRSAIRSTIQRYADQIKELLDKKQEEYKTRDDKRRALSLIQRKLVKRYNEAEERFVPAFKELARLFLGLDLDIRLQTGTTHGVWLEVEVDSTVRRQFYQLSESQRFFIDIALRMALMQYMVQSGGCLLIDTPEGSLDIAYESRAGKMFARFSKAGFELIMTANINTSRLLLSLAGECGTAGMTLYRMTTWTQLSEVQLAEQRLFDDALAGIQNALTTKRTPGHKRARLDV